MKIGFFGTPQIAREVLDELCCRHEVVFAVSSIDKPVGRSKKVCKTPVKACAEEHCFEIIQPDDLKNETIVDALKDFKADIFVVFAYGQIIPRSVFEIPPLGTINLHPSLLPKYRGAAPVQWVIINGEQKTGVTIQLIDDKLDSGDIVCQEELVIDPEWSSCDLYEKIIPIGVQLIDKAVNGLSDGSITPVKQNHEKATYCKKITRDTAHIDWNNSAETIHNLVRGLNPKPLAWTHFREAVLKIGKTRLRADLQNDVKLLPGELKKYSKKCLLVGTGEGVVEILQLQPAGKKMMDAIGFLNGARLDESETLL